MPAFALRFFASRKSVAGSPTGPKFLGSGFESRTERTSAPDKENLGDSTKPNDPSDPGLKHFAKGGAGK
jgi:hypothetical protein